MEQSPLADVFDAHVRHEFADKNVDATMQTMTAEPYLLHLPTLTGGEGHKAVRCFYEQVFVGKWPADTKVVRLSRTVGSEQVVDELLISFTHDVPMEFMLPGIPPTGKPVELPTVVVMKFEGGKIAHEHILGSGLAPGSSRIAGSRARSGHRCSTSGRASRQATRLANRSVLVANVFGILPLNRLDTSSRSA